jgi:serine/threonine protein kinase
VRPAAGHLVGRFRLKSELGRGAQATVWRAHDERLDRDVAIKLLDPAAGTVAVNQWLHEARAVSRLAHPHIVPLFEADEAGEQPYLVFELVAGRTLAETLRAGGAMPARDAVSMMLGVLDALRLAHKHGIVHRDLKPSNILIDGDGRARVMDFGIAARLADRATALIVGTPGYMSPEAARGDAPSAGMDVFASGLVLAEMLSGRPLLRDNDPIQTVHRVQVEDLVLPAVDGVDDTLRGLVQRALARDPAKRFDSAQALHEALQRWLEPAPDAAAGGAGINGTLDFLLRRMRHKSDFPALSQSIVRIQRIASSETESLGSLSAEILKDVALTNKLLRLVNTAHYTAAGGAISTVSRAAAMVGFAGIRNMALSLMLVDHMKDKAHAQRLRLEFRRALAAGLFASELMGHSRDSEEAFLGAMLGNLGRLLTEYYLPEEAQAIRDQLATDASQPSAGQEDTVSARVLGLGYRQLGLGVARSWGLPETLQRSIASLGEKPPTHAVPAGPDRLRWVAAAANEVADSLLNDPAEQLKARLHLLAETHGHALGMGASDFRRVADATRERMSEVSVALGLVDGQGGGSNSAERGADAAGPRATGTGSADAPTLVLAPSDAAGPAGADGEPAVQAGAVRLLSPEQAAELMSGGIQDITNALSADQVNLNSVLRMVLEVMYRALDLQRIVLCLRDAKTEMLTGRFGLGDRAELLCTEFRVPLKLAPGAAAGLDLMAAVCSRGADTLIADTTTETISKRLPPWFARHAHAGTCVLLPMVMKGSPFGLIYGDRAAAGSLVLGERELSLIRTLRNQAVMAFRHAG